MARFFFDVIADGDLAPDEEGMNLPNLDAARREASRALAEIARDAVRSDVPRMVISVRTEEGPVCEAVFQWNLS
jgi:hypothetical protein